MTINMLSECFPTGWRKNEKGHPPHPPLHVGGAPPLLRLPPLAGGPKRKKRRGRGLSGEVSAIVGSPPGRAGGVRRVRARKTGRRKTRTSQSGTPSLPTSLPPFSFNISSLSSCLSLSLYLYPFFLFFPSSLFSLISFTPIHPSVHSFSLPASLSAGSGPTSLSGAATHVPMPPLATMMVTTWCPSSLSTETETTSCPTRL